MDLEAINQEMARTAYQKNAVSKLPPEEVLQLAIAFFKEHGYRANLTGRPNQMVVFGGKEGGLPRVTGEVFARPDVGKSGTTLVALDAAGERLGPTMKAFYDHLRSLRTQSSG